MFTKEELLEKGVSEEVADEIISGLSEDDSLTALSKALGDGEGESGSLFKAEGEEDGDDESEDDDYDEKYMKRYMKKYMKSNGSACKKMMKEMGMMKAEMSDSFNSIDASAEGAIVEMTDLSPVLDKFSETIDTMSKAIEAINDRVDVIARNSDTVYDLQSKSARVMLEMGKAQEFELSQSTGRKSTSTQNLQKAHEYSQNDSNIVYKTLLKAVKEGNESAGMVLSSFESNGKNLSKLNPAQRKVIAGLIQEDK